MNINNDAVYKQLLEVYNECLIETQIDVKNNLFLLSKTIDFLKKTAISGKTHTETYLGYLTK